jgi:murein DD-endopeptidase MepM/ murein hydrolase activator NlpD
LHGSGGKHGALGGKQGGREHRGKGKGTLRKHKSKRHHKASTHAAAGISTTPVLAITPGSYTLDPFTALQLSRLSTLIGATNQPPAFLVPIYKAAGRHYRVPWQILAAINAIETNFGRNLNVSSAGAIGWMQFMPTTWLEYGMDVTRHGRRMNVNGQGQPNPYDPTDAIFAAARYLAANGAPHNIRKAIFAYNHALWYVDAVLWRAQTISDKAFFGLHKTGYSLPLDGRYMRQLGRTDDGVDIESAPDGAAVYSITPGVVTAVASDPSGFGPNYPVILATKGPLQGQYIYYGHVAASLVKVGQQVIAGQPIAVMGHAGNAVSLGHGHIEIGFSDGSGSPLNHGLASAAWTPSGDAMRRVLIAVTRAFDRARSAGSHAHVVHSSHPHVVRNHFRTAHAQVLRVPSRFLKRP